MPTDHLLEIKKLAIVAMFSDETLMDTLVLKGGNLLDIVYEVADRASADLDFSIDQDFSREELDRIKQRIREALQDTFRAHGYVAFDICFVERPKQPRENMKDFWGGYRIEFKVIDEPQYSRLEGSERKLRTGAYELDSSHRKAFKIEISKFEYCKPKQPREINGSTIYVYTPKMLVFEKLRAICQQMPDYLQGVDSATGSARARDFFDIHTVLVNFKMDLFSKESRDLLKHIFQAKRVPLRLIGEIPKYREYHRQDFVSVQDTVRPGIDLRSFDFYFDYVVEHCCNPLKPFWEKQPPSG